ncbi:MAG TPA: zf-HC2 domain-containing protein [Acidisarcina sp.]
MADRNPIDPKNVKGPAETAPRALPCEEWEALLADALDGSLLPNDSAAFKAHTESCAACMELLTRAKQGQEWLQFLVQPPVASDLVAKILARTSGAAVSGLGHADLAMPLPVAAVPMWQRMSLPMRRAAQPRMLMTTAMAFFSIALTLNLAGVRLTGIHVADLSPSLMRTNLTRQFINSKVGVENYCYNLKIVYEMEARVRELKRSSEAEEAPSPAQQQSPAGSPKGSAHKSNGKSENPHTPEPRASLWGSSVEATMHLDRPALTARDALAAQGLDADISSGNRSGINQKSYVRPDTDRAEGSLA